jgi:hypothetical protein
MDSEQKFWIGVWSLCVVVACTTIGCATAYNISQTAAIKKLVDGGADPLSAACAFDVRAVACAVRIGK